MGMDDTFECAHCGQDVPSDQIVMSDLASFALEPWCRECYINFEPSEPPTEEEVAASRQHHFGEGVKYPVLKGR